MNKRIIVILIVCVVLLFGCQRSSQDNQRQSDASNQRQPNSGDQRRLDLGGNGIVTFRLKNIDVNSPPNTIEQHKITNVQAITFYENYIVIQAEADKRNIGRAIPISQIEVFSWDKY